MINLDEHESIGTHWIAFYVNGGNGTYFDSFCVEHIPKKYIKYQVIKILYQIFIEYKPTI